MRNDRGANRRARERSRTQVKQWETTPCRTKNIQTRSTVRASVETTPRANGLDTTANQPAPPTATLDPFEWASPRWDQDDTTVARPDVPEGLRGDTDKSVAFLEILPRPWQLPAIIPDPVIDPQTGRKVPMPPDVAAYTRPDGARRFIDQWQGVRNLYFAINCLRPGMTTKADKSEIDEIVMLRVDVDPPKRKDIDLAMEQAHILDRLKGYHPRHRSSSARVAGIGASGCCASRCRYVTLPMPMNSPSIISPSRRRSAATQKPATSAASHGYPERLICPTRRSAKPDRSRRSPRSSSTRIASRLHPNTGTGGW